MKTALIPDTAAFLLVGELLAECFRNTPTCRSERFDAEALMAAWGVIDDSGKAADLHPIFDFLARSERERSEVLAHVFSPVVSKECPPYETEYHPLRNATYLSHELADISGFYLAFGLRVDAELPERVDHLSLEIDYVTHLLTRLLYLSEAEGEEAEERRSITLSALRSFVQSHLGTWVHLFARLLHRRVNDLSQTHSGGDHRLEGLLQAAEALSPWMEGLCKAFDIHPDRIEGLADRPEDPPETMMECGECLSAGS